MREMLCVAGKNNIAVDVLSYLLQIVEKNKILTLPIQADTGKDSWQKSFRKKCCEEGLQMVCLKDIYEIKDLIFLSLEYDKLINVNKFRSNQLFNIHFSKLPQYRGMYTSVWPILNGEKQAGVTIHKIDNGIDTGDIIDQISFNINQTDTSRDLYYKFLKYGTMLTIATLPDLLNNSYHSYPQSVENASYYSKGSIDFLNFQINYYQPAICVYNQIRAFSFREYQMPKIAESQIIKSEVLNEKSYNTPGTILQCSEEVAIVCTLDYNVKLFLAQNDAIESINI